VDASRNLIEQARERFLALAGNRVIGSHEAQHRLRSRGHAWATEDGRDPEALHARNVLPDGRQWVVGCYRTQAPSPRDETARPVRSTFSTPAVARVKPSRAAHHANRPRTLGNRVAGPTRDGAGGRFALGHSAEE
jgi:hypothetical protein